MDFQWDQFTIPLLVELGVGFFISVFVYLIPFLQLCCVRSDFRNARWYGKSRTWLTRLMLSFAAGMLAQSLANMYIRCMPGCAWVSLLLSLMVTGLVLAGFVCAKDIILPAACMLGLFWVLRQIWPGKDPTKSEEITFLVCLLLILILVVILMKVKARIRAIILEWIVQLIACMIIVYFMDYITSAALNVFIGPAQDLLGSDEYDYQRLWHAVLMAGLYIVNRAVAVSAALVVDCYAPDPDRCTTACRNHCCCCCCDTDDPDHPTERMTRAQRRATTRARTAERIREGEDPDMTALYDYDYGDPEEEQAAAEEAELVAANRVRSRPLRPRPAPPATRTDGDDSDPPTDEEKTPDDDEEA